MRGETGIGTQLATADGSGRRIWVYPADVSGRYRRRRNLISGALLVVFLLLPWLRVGGGQAVLLDLWHGRFALFGLRLWTHDAPLLLFVLGGAAILLAFVTAVWGRVWCGWACPQTVFVDMVFRRVERWIEGDAVERRQRDAAPWNAERAFRKVLKWSVYLGISLVLSHSFLAYFLGTEALAGMMQHSPSKSPGSFLAMAGMTGAVLFDFGWLREQFCTLLCPYGRFQSVLMDEKSITVAYDQGRGEPRRGCAAVVAGQAQGDCVDCRKCVQVCPTGIDIRNGLQMECIGCTACIDACDGVMRKLHKPEGLIRYTAPGHAGGAGLGRPAGYLAVLIGFLSALIWILVGREPVEFTFVRKVGAPYEEVIRPGLEKEVVNQFKIDVLNQAGEPMIFSLRPQSGAEVVRLVSPELPLELMPGQSRRIDLFIEFPFSRIHEGRGRTRIEARSQFAKSERLHIKVQEVPLVGPLR